jgi:mannitol-1-phosphate 5-dehydrogenase
MKKLVLFRAGKIGRSFIEQSFSTSGFEVVFVDIFEMLINELNFRKEDTVVIKSDLADEFIQV